MHRGLIVGERRRRTMGARGALPDPIANIRYGQTCDCGRYCDCSDGSVKDWHDEYARSEESDAHVGPSAGDESGGVDGGDVAAAAGAAVVAGVAVGAVGAIGVVAGLPIVAAAGIGGFVVKRLLSRK